MDLAEPTHAVTITQPGTNSAEITKRLRLFTSAVREKYPDFQMLWAAEESEDGMIHVHGIYYIGNTERGLSRKVIEYAKGRAGIPTLCFSKPIPRGARAQFMGYMTKTLGDPKTAARFHELNRSPSRLRVYQGRGFFRDGAGGRPLTLREAKKLSFQRSRSRASTSALSA